MNPNAYEVICYMIIHFLLFLFKNVFAKWLLKLSSGYNPKNDKDEIQLLKEKLNTLKEQIREISPTSEYVKYTKMERQINTLDEEIKRKESNMEYKENFTGSSKDMNILQKIINLILNSYIFKFFMYFLNVIEYIFLKNKYLEVDYENNKENIVANYFYNENDNKYYALIPVYRILISETIVLNSMYNLIQKFF